jgi:large subunit ribosomal protein L25
VDANCALRWRTVQIREPNESKQMAEVKITATTRTEFGKGASRRTRVAGQVPAVIYGHGSTPRHITLPAHELMLALKNSNVLLDLQIGAETQLALPKAVVRNAIKGNLEHLDLVVVTRGEKVIVDVFVHASGEFDRDGILEHVNNTIQVETDASKIPSELLLDITGLTPGNSATAGDVVLPAGVTLVSPADLVVVHVGHRPTSDGTEVVAETEATGDVAEPVDAA